MMVDPAMPKIGLVTDNDLNRHMLQAVLVEGGYSVVTSVDSKALSEQLKATGEFSFQKVADALLIDVDSNDENESMRLLLDCLLENNELPLLISDEVPDSSDQTVFKIWRRKLLEKMELLLATHTQQNDDAAGAGVSENVEHVWVLAASLGGPESLKRFLRELPADLPISMVYGQHIEKEFDHGLTQALSSCSSYPMDLIRGRHLLKNGHIAVIPADRQLCFLPGGNVLDTKKPWEGSYQPALDQVIAELAKIYRENLGVIIFSGTCDDGVIGCRVAKGCGATVWVQEPSSCLSDSMPVAALDTGCVSFQGTPEQLAQALAKKFPSQTGQKDGATHYATSFKRREQPLYKVG